MEKHLARTAWQRTGLWAAVLLAVSASSLHASESARVARGLEALYLFEEQEGAIVRDRSEKKPSLDLRIDKTPAVQRGVGTLIIESPVAIRSVRPAQRIAKAIQQSGELTVEAWIKPANTKQKGPARIVTLSGSSVERNFTLGQQGARYDVRLRTNKTNANGLPSVQTDKRTAKVALTHVAYTRDRAGRARIYVNGRRQVEDKAAGDLGDWRRDFHLSLANEATGDRPWLGELHLSAVYSQALSQSEVMQNFKAGSAPQHETVRTESARDELFTTKVAPLLALRCLECHDSASREGGLDLSKRTAAAAGGDSGPPVVDGRPTESLLWQRVDSGEMPPEDAELTVAEKSTIREWIEAGASWPLEEIDAAVYAHQGDHPASSIRRLTVPEYIATVQSAVGVDVARAAREILPPDLRADGFSNTAYNLTVDLPHVEAYARLAELIVNQMNVLEFAARFSDSDSLSTDNTMRDFVEEMGTWLLRGPLEEREITLYSGIATTVASAGGSYEQAVAGIIEAMLQSPRFMYQIEDQRGDGTLWPAGDYELASRLSYLVWGASPDEELFRAAEEGELQDPRELREQVQRLLQEPRAIGRSRQFLAEWLDLDRLQNLQPNRQKHPDWSPQLAADMRAETLAYFEDLVWKQNRPLADLFNAQFTYATPQLAKHYGLKPQGPGLKRYDLTSYPARGGLLTHGSVLTIGGDEASMVTRGLFMLHDILRGVVNDPPAGLDTTPVPARPGMSRRAVAEQRLADAACTGCHSRFEPLAFGFEKYDGLGRFLQRDEHGNSLRSDGQLLTPGAAKPVAYETTAELLDLLAASDRVSQTMSWKLTQFGLGRPLSPVDAPLVVDIHQAARKSGGTYQALVTELAASDLVRMIRTVPAEH